MNREDIIRMAREAGLHYSGRCTLTGMESHIERFAALVASAERESLRESFRVVTAAEASAAILHEREACIVDIQWHIPRAGRHTPEYQMAMRMIERIRARGQA